MESYATRHSAFPAFTETVEFLERSLASMLMRYCCSMIGSYFFSRHNRFAETHSHLQLSYHITDRLLAAGNKKQLQFTLSCSDMSILVLGCLGAAHHFDIYIYLGKSVGNLISS